MPAEGWYRQFSDMAPQEPCLNTLSPSAWRELISLQQPCKTNSRLRPYICLTVCLGTLHPLNRIIAHAPATKTPCCLHPPRHARQQAMLHIATCHFCMEFLKALPAFIPYARHAAGTATSCCSSMQPESKATAAGYSPRAAMLCSSPHSILTIAKKGLPRAVGWDGSQHSQAHARKAGHHTGNAHEQHEADALGRPHGAHLRMVSM